VRINAGQGLIIDEQEVVFVRSDGELCQNAVCHQEVADKDGNVEVRFFELLGLSGQGDIPRLRTAKGETYRRLMICPVFPAIKEPDARKGGEIR
jgi:hypothetical protein